MKLNWNKFWKKWANFQEKQEEAEKAAEKYDYLLYGGAGGGGKSYFLRKYPVKFLIKKCWHELGLKGVRVGIFCENYPTLWDRHINRIVYEFPTWMGVYKGNTHEFVINEQYGGGVIAFRNLDDPSKYMSSEFALIAVDELTKNHKQTFDDLRWRKRWTGVEKSKFIAGTNPGGIGHEWVKKLWLERKFDEGEQEKDEFFFVPARATDNRYLPQSYYKVLDSLPEKMRKAYRDGNWDVFEGQYFTEWDATVHVVKPFEIPGSWKRFRAYDHGREAPAVCLWFALDWDGRVYCYRELYVKGLNVDQIAFEINRLSGGETYDYSVADPSIFANIGFVDKFGGQTIAETFSRYGIIFMPGSNRRIDGWNLMHQYLHVEQPRQQPKLLFFETCKEAIRSIPALIHDEIKPEDLDTEGDDHCADTTRYFLMSLHERASPKPISDTEKKLEQLKMRDSITPVNFNEFYSGKYGG